MIERLILREKGPYRGYLSDKQWMAIVDKDRSSVALQGFKGNEGATNGSQSLNQLESLLGRVKFPKKFHGHS